MTTRKPIRILIVDDHPMMLEGLKGFLSKQPQIAIVGTTTSGKEGVGMAEALTPDVIILDISMPDLGGIEAAKQIKIKSPGAKILFHSLYDDKEYVRQFVSSGAKGFITKRSELPEVLRAIEAVSSGTAFFSPEISAALLEVVAQQPVLEAVNKQELTEQERKIISLVADGHSNREIAKLLFVSPRTVETHRSKIMSKLGFHQLQELFNYAYKHGLGTKKK
jgi:DNA-binding NarL/FixJ family response regulator